MKRKKRPNSMKRMGWLAVLVPVRYSPVAKRLTPGSPEESLVSGVSVTRGPNYLYYFGAAAVALTRDQSQGEFT